MSIDETVFGDFEVGYIIWARKKVGKGSRFRRLEVGGW